MVEMIQNPGRKQRKRECVCVSIYLNVVNKEVKEEVKKKTITKTCLFYCLHPF